MESTDTTVLSTTTEPTHTNPVDVVNRIKRNEYMKNYMRLYRAKKKAAPPVGAPEKTRVWGE